MNKPNDIIESQTDVPISREKAIEIGALFDLMEDETRETVLKMGFPYPVAITYSAYCEGIYCSNDKKSATNAFSPGLFAVLQAFQAAVRRGNPNETVHFEVLNPQPGQPPIAFKSVYELDDDGSPVLTITTFDESNTLNPVNKEFITHEKGNY